MPRTKVTTLHTTVVKSSYADATTNAIPQLCNLFDGFPHRSCPCDIRAVPMPPPNLKIKRARVVVNHVGVKRLTECESCGEQKHILQVKRSAM